MCLFKGSGLRFCLGIVLKIILSFHVYGSNADNFKIKLVGEFIPTIGVVAPNKMPVVVYTDCLCPNCYKMIEALKKIEKQDKTIFIVFKELPVHGEMSAAFAVVALLAHRQGKYFQFKQCLKKYLSNISERDMDKVSCLKPAKMCGVNLNIANENVLKSKIIGAIKENFDEINSLLPNHKPYTPITIIGKTVIKGIIAEDRLKNIINQSLKPN